MAWAKSLVVPLRGIKTTPAEPFVHDLAPQDLHSVAEDVIKDSTDSMAASETLQVGAKHTFLVAGHEPSDAASSEDLANVRPLPAAATEAPPAAPHGERSAGNASPMDLVEATHPAMDNEGTFVLHRLRFDHRGARPLMAVLLDGWYLHVIEVVQEELAAVEMEWDTPQNLSGDERQQWSYMVWLRSLDLIREFRDSQMLPSRRAARCCQVVA